MKILSMTATFGRLSHQTLTLQPGLNVIEAPNEWGKSTWSAFIVAMLYGIDTRQQTTKAALADKERFAPWNGEPMSGRMELAWNGKNITIERSTKGRIPFGEFRAYETETGLAVPELTAANCGQTLLGVERAVFVRSGFIRLQDMPVTQDETLRRRLNNLVTTGDESGAGDTLGKQLRDLKNKCRYNRSGLLPQAEYEREQLKAQLQQQEDLQMQIDQLHTRQATLEDQLSLLENHADNLRYQASQQGMLKIQAASELCQTLETELAALQAQCDALPAFADAEAALQQGQSLQRRQAELSMQQQNLPSAPLQPEVSPAYEGLSPRQIIETAQVDAACLQILQNRKKRLGKLPLIYGLCAAAVLITLAVCYFALQLTLPVLYIAGLAALVVSGICVFSIYLSKSKKATSQMERLRQKHPGLTPDQWEADAKKYVQLQDQYSQANAQYKLRNAAHWEQQQALEADLAAYTAGRPLEAVIAHWEWALQTHQQLGIKRREHQNATEHLSALQAVASTAPEPPLPDKLTFTSSETESKLQGTRFELRQLQLKLGQCLGQLESIGHTDVLKARLDSVNRRIGRLEAHYRALELAQDVLYQASTSLQRRFAPRISKLAQENFSKLTGGRYQKITLSDDLSVSTSAENEDILRSSQWRSDGTIDQLYLSLRLAVAGELTPDAPLVLDDALVRFDDDRLKAAMTLLQEQAAGKQVILFSCQGREKKIAEQI